MVRMVLLLAELIHSAETVPMAGEILIVRVFDFICDLSLPSLSKREGNYIQVLSAPSKKLSLLVSGGFVNQGTIVSKIITTEYGKSPLGGFRGLRASPFRPSPKGRETTSKFFLYHLNNFLW